MLYQSEFRLGKWQRKHYKKRKVVNRPLLANDNVTYSAGETDIALTRLQIGVDFFTFPLSCRRSSCDRYWDIHFKCELYRRKRYGKQNFFRKLWKEKWRVFPALSHFHFDQKSLKTSQGNKFQSQLPRFRDSLRFGSWIRRVKTGKGNFKDDRKCNLHDIGSHGSPADEIT